MHFFLCCLPSSNKLNMPQQQQSNFHSNLTSNFGRKALELYRFIERRSISDAKWSNNLHFNLSLKRLQIFSSSLSISSTVKGPRAEKILFKAKRSLLTERIRQTHAAIANIRKDKADAVAHLKRLVGDAVYEDCETRFRGAFTKHFNTTRDKQKAKMARLISMHKKQITSRNQPLVKISKEKAEEIKKKWIYNTSSKQLTPQHTQVLEKGLAFTPTPHKPPLLDLIVSVETAARQLGPSSDAASSIRASTAKLLQQPSSQLSNITRDERLALNELKNDNSISVLPADKGRATVIMDKEEYHRKMATLVGNTTTYEKLAVDPTQQYRATIMTALHPTKSYLPAPHYHRLAPSSTANPPLMFGQPNVHKPNIPLLPIVSCGRDQRVWPHPWASCWQNCPSHQGQR